MIDKPDEHATSPQPEPSAPKGEDGKMPAAGPHARRDLTDPERTPGAGTLPDVNEDDVGDGASS